MRAKRASAGAALAGHAGDVAGAVAQQRQRLLGQRREDELAVGAVRDEAAGLGVDDLDEEVVLLHVQAVARLRALGGDARADDLAQPVDVERLQAELGLELGAHGLGPRLGAEHADLERELVRADPRLAQALGDVQRVGGRAAQDLARRGRAAGSPGGR